MKLGNIIHGFSQLSHEEKIKIASGFASDQDEFTGAVLANHHPGDDNTAEITENAISDFYLPYSVAPNFRINGKDYMVPMVTEESSVVAAASAASKFWYGHGGFETTISNTTKPGHIHFTWKGSYEVIGKFISDITEGLLDSVEPIARSMKTRGGGIESVKLENMTGRLSGYYKLEVLFNTVDAMGANFINTCLETMAGYIADQAEKNGISSGLEIIMSILSNYTPQCLVKCRVSCDINALEQKGSGQAGSDFARRFETAVTIAHHDISRAVTHNKGIFNGVDAVVLATGNDFRAVEAAGHSWACKDGTYRSLSETNIHGGAFEFKLELPMPVGVTGGLTDIHPMARASLQLLGNPDAKTLMSVAASAGMANHFSAVKALITGGIQQGHMKLHLMNILNRLNADRSEKEAAKEYFSKHKVSYSSVKQLIEQIRSRN